MHNSPPAHEPGSNQLPLAVTVAAQQAAVRLAITPSLHATASCIAIHAVRIRPYGEAARWRSDPQALSATGQDKKTGAESVLERLRTATRSQHAKLSSSPAMLRLFDPAYTASEYRNHLLHLLGLFEPFERAVSGAAVSNRASIPLDRSSALREDLRVMGATPTQIDAVRRCPWVPVMAPESLSGYTYVVLGSMLGGQMIVKHLRAVLGPTASFRFYGDGAGRPEPLWAAFCSDLETRGRPHAEAICATAVNIFDCYAKWFSDAARSN